MRSLSYSGTLSWQDDRVGSIQRHALLSWLRDQGHPSIRSAQIGAVVHFLNCSGRAHEQDGQSRINSTTCSSFSELAVEMVFRVDEITLIPCSWMMIAQLRRSVDPVYSNWRGNVIPKLSMYIA